MTRLGGNIRAARAAQNLTQVALGELCNCTAQYISELERGKVPSLRFLGMLALMLEAPLTLLFEGVAAEDLLTDEVTEARATRRRRRARRA